MIPFNTQPPDSFLHAIINRLVLNASFINNLGLYHGKMGIAIFFAYYAKYTQNTLYENFTYDLIEEIYEDIHTEYPVNLENGLCGIGWGILYLLQNSLIQGEPDEILSVVDQKIMERNVLRMTDFSVETGLAGMYAYIQKRIKYNRSIGGSQPFDKQYWEDWEKLSTSEFSANPVTIDNIIDGTDFSDKMDITKYPLGLNNGCAGYGLRLLLQT